MDNENTGNEYQNMQFGEIAVKLGYISREALNSILLDFKSSKNANSQFLIGEILIKKKLLNKKQLKHVLSLQDRKLLRCNECRKKFSIKNYNPDKNYRCPHCSKPLILQDESSQRNKALKKKKSARHPKSNTSNSDMQSQNGEMLISSNIADIARQAFSISNEPYDRYSEFMRSFSDDTDEETREVQEIIDTKSEEIVVIDEDSNDFEAEFSIIDSDDYYNKKIKKRKESSVAMVDDSFVIGSSTNFDQSGISVLKILEEERGIHANIELSTDPLTERHLKKLKRINSVSKYIVYDEVGRGGMGVIKLSFDQDVRRQIATKIIHPTSKEIPSKQERFLEEAQITGQLEHPNIVPVHDLGIDNDGNLFFTMKLVQGKSLLEIIELVADKKDGYHKYFTVTRFLQIFMKICDAIAFAHSKGVLHRDIKPENIMVGDYGEVMVMDWGLAKVKGLPDKRIDQVSTDRSLGKIHQTLDGSIVGTPGYMAPEQARGNLEDITEQSDIYSLGTILYEILTYKQAFPGSDSSKVIQKVKRHKFLPPSLAAPLQNIPRELEHVVLNAMAYEPEERYLTVNQLKEEIEAYINGRVLSSVDYSMFQLFIKWIMRNITSLAIAIAIGLSFLITAIIWINDMSHQRDLANNRTGELFDANNDLKNVIKKLKDESLLAIKADTERSNLIHIQEAFRSNNLAKLKELRNNSSIKYANLIDYYIAKQENPYIEKISEGFFGKILICKAVDDEIALITSNNTLYIYEDLNIEPVKTIRFQNSPSSISISDNGMIILATFNNGVYQILDSFGSIIYENSIDDFEINKSAVSPLGNLIAVSNISGNIKFIKWRENIRHSIDNLESSISSNLTFINQSTLCASLENTNFVKISWDNELNSIDIKILASDSVYRKIYTNNLNIILVDVFNTIISMKMAKLHELATLSDLSPSNSKLSINNQIYFIDISKNCIWEMKQNELYCRDLSSGIRLKKYKYPGSDVLSLLKIIEFKNQIFIFTTDGFLYKLSKSYYADIPLFINNSINPLKIMKYKNDLFMLTSNGIFKNDFNTFTMIKSTASYDNKIKTFNYNNIGFLFLGHENNEISLLNLVDMSYKTLTDIKIRSPISINSIRSSLDNSIIYLTILTDNNILWCFEINQLMSYRMLWSKKINYANLTNIALIPTEDNIFIPEDNNLVFVYNILNGNKIREFSVNFHIDEIFASQDGKILFIVGTDNLIRYTNINNLNDYQTFSSNYFTSVNRIITNSDNSWILVFSSDEAKIRKYTNKNEILSFACELDLETVFFDEENNRIYYFNNNTRTIDYLSLKEINRIFQ